ncbi:MAG: sugar metabolism transcriptional regulator [Rhodospirillales bacterium]|jgi:putative ferrous iron transport protein C|nr:sugar metabolism transcriptional regulator [Rhodospirillales bacterium]
MILSDMRAYIREHRRVSIVDISRHFDSEPDAVRGMLSRWIAKGQVRQLKIEKDCGGCSKCGSEEMEIYEWIN